MSHELPGHEGHDCALSRRPVTKPDAQLDAGLLQALVDAGADAVFSLDEQGNVAPLVRRSSLPPSKQH